MMYTNNRRFEWDYAKALLNLAKHGIDFDEAVTVFHDFSSLFELDEAHSTIEPRTRIIGQTDLGKTVVVVFTMRTEATRIISARPTNRKERKRYEENRQI